MQKKAFILRHVCFEDLGTLEAVLIQFNYSIKYIEVGYDNLSEVLKDPCDLLVVLGGPIGVFEVDNYPFISEELDLIRQRVTRNAPTLGICLGAQMIAHVCGGSVYSAEEKEIGWSPLKLTYDEKTHYFKHLENVNVLHWHGDTFTKPENPHFKIHASTSLCQHQAFTVGTNILGLQFHGEVDAKQMEKWLIGHAHEISCLQNQSVKLLREQARLFGETTKKHVQLFFESWIKQLI